MEMIFAACSNCGRRLGALSISVLIRELQRRDWGIAVDKGASYLLRCDHCSYFEDASCKWRGESLRDRIDLLISIIDDQKTKKIKC